MSSDIQSGKYTGMNQQAEPDLPPGIVVPPAGGQTGDDAHTSADRGLGAAQRAVARAREHCDNPDELTLSVSLFDWWRLCLYVRFTRPILQEWSEIASSRLGKEQLVEHAKDLYELSSLLSVGPESYSLLEGTFDTCAAVFETRPPLAEYRQKYQDVRVEFLFLLGLKTDVVSSLEHQDRRTVEARLRKSVTAKDREASSHYTREFCRLWQAEYDERLADIDPQSYLKKWGKVDLDFTDVLIVTESVFRKRRAFHELNGKVRRTIERSSQTVYNSEYDVIADIAKGALRPTELLTRSESETGMESYCFERRLRTECPLVTRSEAGVGYFLATGDHEEIIAEALGISVGTVRRYRRRLFETVKESGHRECLAYIKNLYNQTKIPDDLKKQYPDYPSTVRGIGEQP